MPGSRDRHATGDRQKNIEKDKHANAGRNIFSQKDSRQSNCLGALRPKISVQENQKKTAAHCSRLPCGLRKIRQGCPGPKHVVLCVQGNQKKTWAHCSRLPCGLRKVMQRCPEPVHVVLYQAPTCATERELLHYPRVVVVQPHRGLHART